MNFKKLFIFFILFFFAAPVSSYAQEQENEQQEAKQLVLAVDEADDILEGSVEITEEKPFLSDFIEVKEDEPFEDEILLETDFNPTYRVNSIKEVKTYSKTLELPAAEDVKIGSTKFNIASKSTQYNDSNTLNKNVQQELGATVRGKYLSLTGGFETTYDTTNITSASRGAFITPSIRLGERASISFKNKISGQKLNKYEPMVGIDYKPKYIKNSSIWMGAGATILDNNLQSQSLNLRTNFYVF